MKDLKDINCWVVSEGMAGTENQCIAVAEALGVNFDIKRLSLRQPWKSFSPYLGFEQSWSFLPSLMPNAQGQWPDLVIASGRKSIAASRYIKRKSGGKTFTVQIQDPRISPDHFDLVALPHHDPTRGDNILVTAAAPNRITPDKLKDAQKHFPQLEHLSSPRVAVLLGGSSKAYTLDAPQMRRLSQQLKSLIEDHHASLMITPSRRTGEENLKILQDTLHGTDAYIWDGTGDNPYFGMLASADYILATADSASMLSDACTTGKPVYMIELDGGHPRIDALHQHLQELGALRIFEGTLETYDYTALNDASKIATAIQERLLIKRKE